MRKSNETDYNHDRQLPRLRLHPGGRGDWQDANHWLCEIGVDGSEIQTFGYHTGPAVTGDPRVVDVLSSLFMDSIAEDLSFEEWSREFGFDEDSRKAELLWKECRRNTKKLRKLFPDPEAYDAWKDIFLEERYCELGRGVIAEKKFSD